MRIKGLNDKEQKCFNILKDGEPHTIAELKKPFLADGREHCKQVYEKGWGDREVDIQAQSFARNSLRRLVRDGWVEKAAYGTYKMTANGKRWVKDGKDATKSFGTKRGRKPMTDEEKAEAAKKRAKKPKKAAAKKTTKKASAKPASKPKKASKPKANVKAKSTKKNGVSTSKVKAAKAKAGKAAAKDKLEAAKARAANHAEEEASE